MGFSVFILTWDIEGKVPRGEIKELLLRNPAPDIYAIGLQELEQKQTERFSFNRSKNEKIEKEQEWEQCLETTLPGYVRVTTAKLDGTVLFIYIQQSLTAVLENVETKSCGPYSRGGSGPIGAIAARFEMGGVSFCFTNCHLSSQSETLEERNREFYLIWDVLKFPNGCHIYDHDHVFMLGILNHRAERGEVLEGFVEAEESQMIKKYDSDSDYEYYGRKEDIRIPGGCDRILYKGYKGGYKVEEYQQHSYYRMGGDHKPVTGFYRFNFPSYVEIKNSIAWNT